MAFPFVGAGGTVVPEFYAVAVRPTVSIWVEAKFGASRWRTTSRGLLRGRWCFVGEKCVSGSEGGDACRKGGDRCCERRVCLDELIKRRLFGSGGRGEVVEVAIEA